jgi:hypothetical protein
MLTPREQGDFGELSAMQWLVWQGASIALPVGNNRHWDLVAELDGRVLRVQVKTSRSFRLGRWEVRVSTSGGNQSWNRVVKLLDPSRFDYLFVLVGDGRRWFIPSERVEGSTALRLGGRSTLSSRSSAVSQFLAAPSNCPPLQSPPDSSGGCPSGQRSVAVNHVATRTQVRILLPPLLAASHSNRRIFSLDWVRS